MKKEQKRMTINEFRKKAINALTEITDNGEFEADQLMQFALGFSKNELITKRRNALSDNQLDELNAVLARRLAREPLQYICGEWDFFGLRMFCGEGCLIPRSETEMLAEYAIKNLPKGGHFIDLCTGSGCIAVSVLNNRPDVTATAVDISEEALYYARKNAAYHAIPDNRLKFVCCDMLDFSPITIPDMIVSNPPYIKTDDIEGLSPEVLHEPVIALNGGHDGLDFYKIIAAKFGKYLNVSGEIIMEVGYDIAGEVAAVFRAKRFETELVTDLYGVERMCIAKRKKI